ncbi:hypothetical protein RMS29_026905 (plasmid) [Agrobacterium rosae]|uniref:Uncharacterized protein n=1 Tax=Agrobacterium rosae TaxID=1972867 RepID=A0ABU4W2X6_9HYPH|nr:MULTISPECIES: hypothetical protein [Rhizobium/Agrobacterium group]MDX8332139.1 hypothetical protein [Agrobacterium rosae]
MPDITHIATSFAIDSMAGLLVAIPLSLGLIVPRERLWWIHTPCALILLVTSAFFRQGVTSLSTAILSAFSRLRRIAGISRTALCSTASESCGFAALSLIAPVIYAASDQTDSPAIEAKISHRPIPQ